MIKKEKNRARHLSIEPEYIKGVSLIDVDTTLAEYMVDKIIPTVKENENVVKVPLIYGNAERWMAARKEGYLRDQRGKVQIPLVMFKRNSIERDSSLQFFNEQLYIPTYKKYSAKNRYDKFSQLNNTAPVYNLYNITVPEYVTVTYEVMIWTNYTEHMNKIVEAFQWATDRYWGNEETFKFRTRIDSFDTQQEVGEGSERIIRTTFTMSVNAYLLPERYANQPVMKHSRSIKRVVFGLETDLTGNIFTDPSLYNEYQEIIDFVAIRGSQLAEPLSVDGNGVGFYGAENNQIRLTNVKVPTLPDALKGSFDEVNWFRVYINGVFLPTLETPYTWVYYPNTNEIIFTFPNLGLFFNDGDVIDDGDEIAITGKFIEL